MQFTTTGGDDPRYLRRMEKRRAIEAAAWRLFSTRGFAETTVDDIADQVGISQRTFFRYFESKEAVLFGEWEWQLDAIARRIERSPPELSPLAAVRASVMSLAHGVERERRAVMMRSQLTESSSSVRNYYRTVIQPAWEETIAKALAARLGLDPERDPLPYTLAGAAVGALNAAVKIWVARECVDVLPDLTAHAFDRLESLCESPDH